jgi:hypothetical protein
LDPDLHKDCCGSETLILFVTVQYSIAVAARTVDESLGRLSQKVTVRVKPEDVPMNLRGEGVTTHTMRLTWGPPIR